MATLIIAQSKQNIVNMFIPKNWLNYYVVILRYEKDIIIKIYDIYCTLLLHMHIIIKNKLTYNYYAL